MIFLAFKHLFSRKRQTILTLLGIILGTVAYVVISGMMLGFREYLIQQLIDNDAHIHIEAKQVMLETHSLDEAFFPKAAYINWLIGPSGLKNNPRIINPQLWYDILENDPRVIAYSPQLTTQVILTKGGASTTTKLVGVTPSKQQQVTAISSYMIEGNFNDISGGGNRLAIGTDLLKKLGARVNDTIRVSNGKSEPVPFKIIGSFSTGIRNIDEGLIYGNLTDTQAINGTPSQINEIAVRVYDVNAAASMATQWNKLSDDHIQSWDQLNSNIFSVFKIQDVVRYMMTASILIVAGFSIYNILNMVVSQKRKEIAILRSMGYEKMDIVTLFLIQGVILGILGGLIGIAFGYLASKGLSKVPFGVTPMGKGTGTIMVSFNPRIYIIGALLSSFAAIFASWLPARAAGTMTPIDIIRQES
jgi:lipoprotein-releasing system permease protein